MNHSNLKIQWSLLIRVVYQPAHPSSTMILLFTDFTPRGAASAVERRIRDRPDLKDHRYEILKYVFLGIG